MGSVWKRPGHTRTIPEHGDSGLQTIETPGINWIALDSTDEGLGADGFGAIADFSSSITSPQGARRVWTKSLLQYYHILKIQKEN